jgi:two-component system NtrC family sensor kinase
MSAQGKTPNRRVLIVDDNEAIHQDFRKILGGGGETETALADAEAALFGDAAFTREAFELDSAFQGRDALTLVERAQAEGRPYAMAFVDMRMPPGWDGVETIGHLWEENPDLQIVVCTAYSECSWDDITQRLQLGDRLLFLKKPFDNIEVYQMASALTAKWRATEQAVLKMNALEHLVEERTREIRSANEALQGEMAERRLLESQLVQAQKLESIGQLAAGIAHEINTPIQYVGDSVEFLRASMLDIDTLLSHYQAAVERLAAIDARSEVPDRVRAAEAAADLVFLRAEIPRTCERAREGIERVSTIVRAMKEFSFPDAREHSQADINRALETTLMVAQHEYKHIAAIEKQFGELPAVKCNVSELNQVFLNLIVNAAHAIQESGKSPAQGKITIGTSVDGDSVRITIGDNGCGIRTDIANKVFDPFFTTKEVGRGTGQGLSIAYATVVKHHGGTLTFESELGRGTTFIVRVPILGAESSGMSAADEAICA